jgi:spore germination cell wall hydrolase CwlJ-like protein
MSYRVRTANLASLALFSCTAFVMSGVSMADDSTPPPADAFTALVSPTNLSTPAVDPVRKISFAPSREVVQPLDAVKDMSSPLTDDSGFDDQDRPHKSLAALVADTDVSSPPDDEARCLATAVFYEARSESLEGQLAVARVIINRSNSSRFGGSLCSVVLQPRQFSFVRGGRMPSADTARPAWKTAIAIARIAIENAWESKAEGALYFHARRVSPGWRRTRLAAIDNHIFYR